MKSEDQQYHLSCDLCGHTWWDSEAFPSCCPYCKADRTPEVLREILTKRKQMTNEELLKLYLESMEVIAEIYLKYWD